MRSRLCNPISHLFPQSQAQNDDIKPSAQLSSPWVGRPAPLINALTLPSIYLQQCVTADFGFISLSRCSVIYSHLRKPISHRPQWQWQTAVLSSVQVGNWRLSHRNAFVLSAHETSQEEAAWMWLRVYKYWTSWREVLRLMCVEEVVCARLDAKATFTQHTNVWLFWTSFIYLQKWEEPPCALCKSWTIFSEDTGGQVSDWITDFE